MSHTAGLRAHAAMLLALCSVIEGEVVWLRDAGIAPEDVQLRHIGDEVDRAALLHKPTLTWVVEIDIMADPKVTRHQDRVDAILAGKTEIQIHNAYLKRQQAKETP